MMDKYILQLSKENLKRIQKCLAYRYDQLDNEIYADFGQTKEKEKELIKISELVNMIEFMLKQ
jgi:hypothetical protein